jgi:hypothetical protein
VSWRDQVGLFDEVHPAHRSKTILKTLWKNNILWKVKQTHTQKEKNKAGGLRVSVFKTG